jgi:hypothetical protein
MDSIKYIGLDVHKEAIAIAVLNGVGRLVMESIIETKASAILQFIHGLHWRTFVKSHAQGIVACDFLVAATVRFQVLFVFLDGKSQGISAE